MRGTPFNKALPPPCPECLASKKKIPVFGAQGPKIRDKKRKEQNYFRPAEIILAG
jgi:hypothetical protein